MISSYCSYCEHEHTPELAKSLVTCIEAAELLGYEPDRSSKIPSFANPAERTPSLHVYDGDAGWYDFSAGEGGDVIDFVMRATGYEFNKALSQLIHRSLKAGREPGDVERQPVRQIVDFTDQLPLIDIGVGAASEWTKRLGVDIPIDCRFLDGNLLIPHEDQDGVYGVKVREPGGAKTSWPGSQFTKRLYDPRGWLEMKYRSKICIIAEGETDCWALRAFTPYVFALPSGASSWKDHWLKDLEPFEKIWLCMDNDRAGNDARDKLTRKIGYLRVEQLRVPPLFDDAREAIAAGWKPELRG